MAVRIDGGMESPEGFAFIHIHGARRLRRGAAARSVKIRLTERDARTTIE